MEIETNKLQNFERLVLSDAQQQRDQAMEQVQKEKKDRIAQVRSDLEETYKRRLSRELAKVTREKNEQVAARQALQKKELLSIREQLIDGVFSGALKRIEAYVKTEDYKKAMQDAVKEAAEGMSEDILLVVNQKDAVLQDLGYPCELTDEVFYGGCIVQDKKNHIQVDLTMKRKVERLRRDFIELYKLKI